MPAIMVVGVSKESASGLAKVFQRNWTGSLTGFIGAGTRQIMSSK